MAGDRTTETAGDARPLKIPTTPWKTPLEDRVRAALGEVPAYIRRAVRMERAIEALFATAARERRTLLGFVVLRTRRVLDALGEPGPATLRAGPRRALLEILEEVRAHPAFATMRPRPVPPSPRRLARALSALNASVDRFNRRWAAWIDEEAPLARVNEHIDGYNRHYVFERECAVRFAPRQAPDFEPVAPLTADDLRSRFAPLPRP